MNHTSGKTSRSERTWASERHGVKAVVRRWWGPKLAVHGCGFRTFLGTRRRLEGRFLMRIRVTVALCKT